jgi:hypothetical protein
MSSKKLKKMERARLRLIAYDKSVNERVQEYMSLPLIELEVKIREFVIANDDYKIREKELVDQLRECVMMLECVRRENETDTDDEEEN